VSVWLTILSLGFGYLIVYSQTAAADSTRLSTAAAAKCYGGGDAPATWALVVAINPKCPCTAATVTMLERICAQTKGALHCQVLAYCPEGGDESWTSTRTLRRLGLIPRVAITTDYGGVLARELGLTTSGETILLDREHVIRFHGGITPARGHEGDNLGATTVRELVEEDPTSVTTYPIYGCPLSAP